LEQEEIPEKAVKRLKKIARQLKEKGNLLAGMDERFVELGPIEEIEGDIIESDEIASRIADQIEEIQHHLEHLSAPTDKTPVTDRAVSEPPTKAGPGDKKEHEGSKPRLPEGGLVSVGKPKLPKLHIAKFSGEVIKFRTFWDSFNSAVHNNPSMSKVGKFSYLQGLLEGPAATAIQGLTLSDTNYKAARDLLEQRFAKPQYAIATHIDQMYKFPSCTSDKAAQL